MALKSYAASCHCGAVRLEADIDLNKGTNKCNCSLCTKARAWFVFVKPDHIRFVSGTENQSEYQWTPAGKAHPFLHYHFCKSCGIRTYAWGEAEAMGGRFFALSIASLDNVDPDELAAAPVSYADGRNDRFDRPPGDTRLL